MIGPWSVAQCSLNRSLQIFVDYWMIEMLHGRHPGQTDAGRAVAPGHRRPGGLFRPGSVLSPVPCRRRILGMLICDGSKRGVFILLVSGACSQLQQGPGDARRSVGKSSDRFNGLNVVKPTYSALHPLSPGNEAVATFGGHGQGLV